MAFTPDEWNRIVAASRTPSRFATPTNTPAYQGQALPTLQAQTQGANPASRFAGGAADAFRSVVPQGVRDVVGGALRTATSGERLLNLGASTGFGTDIANTLDKIPVVGGLARTAFDVGLAPTTLLTAGFGTEIAAALRGAGIAGKIGAALISPASNSPTFAGRLFSEVVMGTAAGTAAEKVAEETGNPFAATAAGALGGIVAGGVLNVVRNATRNVTPAAVQGTLATPAGASRTFVRDLLPTDELLKEIQPAAADTVGASKVGRAVNSVIDPSANVRDEIGQAMTVFNRQSERGGLLTEVALSGAIDSHGNGLARVAGPGGTVFNVDAVSGKILNVPGTPDLVDFVENLPKYDLTKLTAPQKALADDIMKLLAERRQFRIDNGLKVTKNVQEDLLHVTRVVRGIRDIEDVGRTNEFLRRVYETRAEGIAQGVKYENDLRNIVGLMLQTDYQQAAQNSMEEVLAPLLRKPKDILSATPQGQTVITRLNDSISNLRKARTAVRQSRRAIIASGTGNIRSEVGPAVTTATQDALQNAQFAYFRAKKNYTDALARVQNAHTAPGYIFGNTAKEIPIAKWKGKFLPRTEDYQVLADRMDVLTGRPNPIKVNVVGDVTRQVGDVVRLASAYGDAAAPFVHGLPLLGQNPVAWGKAAMAQYRGMLDPATVGRYVRNNLDTIQTMAQHGVPIGDVEQYIAAADRGGVLTRPVHAFAGTGVGKQTLGRLEAGYDNFLTVARVEAWKALQPGWDGTGEQLATYIRDLTGALSTKALGVSPGQRAFESAWLGFSPRLMRSTIALVAHAANPNDPVGRQAARTLLGLAGVAGLMAVGTNLAISGAKGETEAQAMKRLEDTLNPLTGKFLSVDVGGQRIGVGGQVRAITQFIAKSVAHPSGFATADQFDNPLINFYMGRGSVAVNVAGSLVEGATGGRVNVLPYESIDNLPDAALHLGSSLMPFVLQSTFEARDLSTIDRLVAGTVNFAGFNANEKTPTDRLNEVATQRYGKPFGELTGVQQQTIEADRADLIALRDQQREQFGNYEEKQRTATLKAIDSDRQNAERGTVDAYFRGQISASQFRDELKSLQRDAAVQKRRILGAFDSKASDQNKQALTAWYDTFDLAKYPGTEIVDWDKQAVLEADLFSKLSAEQKQYINERRVTKHDPSVQWFFDNEKTISKSDYYQQVDTVFDRFRARVPGDIPSYSALVASQARAQAEGDVGTALRLKAVISSIDRQTSNLREQLRRKNPELDLALYQNGRVSKPLPSTAAKYRGHLSPA